MKMKPNFLIEVLSEFDINVKHYKISVKNQLNRNYGLFYWLLCFVSLSFLLFNTFTLVLISDDNVNRLLEFGSIGYYCGGRASRFMIDTAGVSYYFFIFVLYFNHLFDKMKWLL